MLKTGNATITMEKNCDITIEGKRSSSRDQAMSSLRDKRSFRTKPTMPAAATAPTEVVVGRVVAIGDNGAPLVDFAGNPVAGPVRALATAR